MREVRVSDLYDTDIVTWSERQSALLRRRAAGELVNGAEIDWPNVAEEIESVGRSERPELRNRMARLQQHLLKWRYQPEHRSRHDDLGSVAAVQGWRTVAAAPSQCGSEQARVHAQPDKLQRPSYLGQAHFCQRSKRAGLHPVQRG
jgi:hypothetical protein